MTVWMFLLDGFLALGACLRLTRFVVADDVPGNWLIKAPLARWIDGNHRVGLVRQVRHPTLARYWDGLNCPHCVSVHFAAFVVVTLWLAGGPGDASEWWRYSAGFLTLSWLAGHIAAWSGDTYSEEG